MRLDPHRTLTPATIAAMRDFFPRPIVPEIDESSLLRLALGIADEETRQACASAMLASPDARMRLVQIRRRLAEQFGPPRDLTHLRLLSVFAGPFNFSDAEAVFPGAFASPATLNDLAERSLIALTDEPGYYRVANNVRDRLESLSDETEIAEGWPLRYVRLYADKAQRIDNIISDGRWEDGSALLKLHIANLRLAWRTAAKLEFEAEIGRFVETLLVTFAESGALDDFQEMVALTYRVAKTLDRPKLTSRALSYEAVVAARRGDNKTAQEFWERRVEYNRQIGNPVGEADALLDLASLAYSTSDHEAFWKWVEEARTAVEASGRDDLRATFHSLLAKERLRSGDFERASEYAERSLAVLSGADGIDMGLFVRINAAQILLRSGKRIPGLTALQNVLALCLEGGRASHAATVLSELADVFQEIDRMDLAVVSLSAAVDIQRGLGAHDRESAELRLDILRAQNERSALEPRGPFTLSWEQVAQRLLVEIREIIVICEGIL